MKAELFPTITPSVSCEISHQSFIFVLFFDNNNLPTVAYCGRLQMNVLYILLIKLQPLW